MSSNSERRTGDPIVQEGYRVQEWGTDPTWERFELAAPGPGEALVAVEACSVGLTVLNCIRGDLADERSTLPRVPGHELIGRVTEVGAGVDPALLGRLVGAYFYLVCGSCPECIAGNDSRCRRLAGVIGMHVDGGYAPFATLPSRNLIVLPDGLDPVVATVVPDAVATPVHICRSRAGIGPGDRVAVIGGGGGVGIHLVQVARLFGAEVAGLDLSDEKLGAIEALGGIGVRSDDFDVLDPVIFQSGRPTVVVDFVGSPRSLGWATRSVAPGGRVVILTTFPDVVASFDPQELVLNEASILGSRYASRAEVAFAADLVASGRIKPVIGLTTGPSEVLEIHRRLREGSLVGRGALTWQ